jgi:hypothetical protein
MEAPSLIENHSSAGAPHAPIERTIQEGLQARGCARVQHRGSRRRLQLAPDELSHEMGRNGSEIVVGCGTLDLVVHRRIVERTKEGVKTAGVSAGGGARHFDPLCEAASVSGLRSSRPCTAMNC